MHNPLYKKEQTPNFAHPAVQKAFLEETQTSGELLHKELDVNRAEQNLLKQRIAMMESFLNDIPASDPQYAILLTQTHMDRIEIDELKRREETILQQLEKAP